MQFLLIQFKRIKRSISWLPTELYLRSCVRCCLKLVVTLLLKTMLMKRGILKMREQLVTVKKRELHMKN